MSNDQLDAFIEAGSALLSLPVDDAWRPAVRANLDLTLKLAAQFLDFPLSDDAEPGPVFRA